MSWPGVGVAFPALDESYDYVRSLGQGGSGWVVLARHRRLGRLEAVKIIRGGSRKLPAVRRLEREGRVLAGLDHPGIISVYRLLTSESSLALAMEFLAGGDLQQAMDGGALSGADRVGILKQVAAALTAAASVGVVHRDVKPSNVLLDGEGRAVLADFGLARLPLDSGAFRTLSGSVTGTPLFMAPEQIADPDNESPSVDAYAFGVLAYRLLLGAWPYPGGTVAQVIEAHRSAAPTDPWAHQPALPSTVGEALLGALAKDPGRRLRPEQLADQLSAVSDAGWDLLVGNGSRPRVDSPASAGAAAADSGPEETGIGGPEVSLTGAATGEQSPEGTSLEQPVDRRPAVGSTLSGPPEVWVQPPIYQVRRRRLSAGMRAALIGLVIGVLLGVAAYVVIIHPMS